jgi:hypothetical protein
LRVCEHGGHVADVGVTVEGLRIGNAADHGVGGVEAGEATNVVAGLGVVVAGFRVALIGGEVELVSGGIVPLLAEGEGTELFKDAATGIGDEAIGEMVVVVIPGAGRIDPGKEDGTGVDVLAGGRSDGGSVVVFGDDFGPGEDVDSVGGRTDTVGDAFLDSPAVAIVDVCA